MFKINSFLATSKPYTGNTYNRIKEMMDVFSLPIYSGTTFYKIQKSVLLPVIPTVHQKYKDHIFKKTCSALDICGDGHSRVFSDIRHLLFNEKSFRENLKFCAVHVGTVKHSSRMELKEMRTASRTLKTSRRKQNTSLR